MKLTIVIPVLNQFEILRKAVEFAIKNLAGEKIELLLIDNGSDGDLVGRYLADQVSGEKVSELKIWRNRENTGNYPVFKQGLALAKGNILAFIHSDLFIYEAGWDKRIIEAFEKNEKLGLIGFIGSTEIDNWGGRGLGTVSNFQGRRIENKKGTIGWNGSKAEVHGKRISTFKAGVIIDGCSMVFRRKCLEEIGFIDDFPIHHFYDRLMCCQALEKGWQVGILGIACDHISGQTVCHEDVYHKTAKEWAIKNLGIETSQDWANKNKDWVGNSNNPGFEKIPQTWDEVIYREAEKRFLREWRDNKHFIPKKI